RRRHLRARRPQPRRRAPPPRPRRAGGVDVPGLDRAAPARHRPRDGGPGRRVVASARFPRGRRRQGDRGPGRPDVPPGPTGPGRRAVPGRTRLLEASSWLPDAGAQAVHQLLADHDDIGAVVCADDSLAHGAMLALRGEGIDVPGEISVVGFGGWEEPITGVGTLASASWPVRELTESAVDTLLDH